MLVKYVHASAPDETRLHDTVKSLKGCIGLIRSLGSDRTQEEWDRHELRCFERDKAKGLILSYEVMKEAE